MLKNKFPTLVACVALCCAAVSCSKESDDEPVIDPPTFSSSTLFVVNEGNYAAGNGSLSAYDTESGVIVNNIFRAANGFALGDVPQSMTMGAGRAWVVVNNSQVIFAIDPETRREQGRVSGELVSPRKMVFAGEHKAYVSQFYSPTIAVIDPDSYTITKQIEYPVPEGASVSTGDMALVGKYLYVCCPNYNKTLLRIDTETDCVVSTLETGMQPAHIVVDANNDLWVLNDGGYYGSPYGYEAPTLVRVSTSDFSVKATYTMNLGDYVSDLEVSGDGRTIFWTNSGIYRMDITSTALPAEPFIDAGGNFFYGLTVDPLKGDIYVADAIDYVQPGRIIRYNSQGIKTAEATTGICPHGFCWWLK